MTSISQLTQGLIAAFEARDLPAALAFFADDAVVIDPHYPQPVMKGKVAIQQGFRWAFTNMKKPGFTVLHTWEENCIGAIEVDTHHVFRGGMKLSFQQVFVCETRDGKITRLQSYLPYAPGGIAGALTKLTRLMWRLQGKLK